MVALFVIFLKNKIVAIKETNFHKNKESYSNHNLRIRFEEKPLHCIFFLLTKKMLFFIFVVRKEHHKRKHQWEILKPGQNNKKESEVKK